MIIVLKQCQVKHKYNNGVYVFYCGRTSEVYEQGRTPCRDCEEALDNSVEESIYRNENVDWEKSFKDLFEEYALRENECKREREALWRTEEEKEELRSVVKKIDEHDIYYNKFYT